ncbi:hypothetical protein NL676_006139 [Syzygium grande]|nr:hypothetical protein NL676_006139 [Syzygium grande]
MQRIDQVKHPNVLSVVAFYSSKQEKLLVYEFQQNGSLFRLLHGTKMGKAFEWGCRLNFAASIAEGLATMHRELRDIDIAHGNLKSSNILLTKDMKPCISEYGLMVLYDNQDQTPSITPVFKPDEKSNPSASRAFGSDVYSFGVILLELLTGKMVHNNNGFDLPKWVVSVVQEEGRGGVRQVPDLGRSERGADGELAPGGHQMRQPVAGGQAEHGPGRFHDRHDKRGGRQVSSI